MAANVLTELEYLELRLGNEEYAFRCQVADLEGIFSGVRLPRLRFVLPRPARSPSRRIPQWSW
ncbi:hypothetical protein [Streptomyces clavifer]|uniref:hypothetical protein n=1 Tax=Streptomyces clavifer TaxID=68188 RepID=UPI00380DB959